MQSDRSLFFNLFSEIKNTFKKEKSQWDDRARILKWFVRLDAGYILFRLCSKWSYRFKWYVLSYWVLFGALTYNGNKVEHLITLYCSSGCIHFQGFAPWCCFEHNKYSDSFSTSLKWFSIALRWGAYYNSCGFLKCFKAELRDKQMLSTEDMCILTWNLVGFVYFFLICAIISYETLPLCRSVLY